VAASLPITLNRLAKVYLPRAKKRLSAPANSLSQLNRTPGASPRKPPLQPLFPHWPSKRLGFLSETSPPFCRVPVQHIVTYSAQPCSQSHSHLWRSLHAARSRPMELKSSFCPCRGRWHCLPNRNASLMFASCLDSPSLQSRVSVRSLICAI
jgi:hypothetical protein